MDKQRAFSLIELLIALVLGSLLILMILEVFELQRNSVSSIQSINESQAKIRFVHEVFSHSIRMSGYYGGIKADDIKHIYKPLRSFSGLCDTAWVLDLSDTLKGAEGGSSAGNIEGLPKDCLARGYIPYSDVLLIKYADPKSLFEDSELDNKANSKRYFLRSGAMSKGVLFDGTNTEIATDILPFESTVFNRQMYVSLFYLSPCIGKDCDHKGNILHQYVLMGNRFVNRRLVSGIDQMQFEYGVDTDENGLVDTYMSAQEVKRDWRFVKSVKVYLLMRQQIPERGFRDSEHILGDLASGSYRFVSEGKESNYKRRVVAFEVFRRNGISEAGR